MKSVAVLLSTYNGEQYIQEQLDSVLIQKGVEIVIIVRDDGSNDNTLKILQRYKAEKSSITVLKEENCGAVMSFHYLCHYAKDNVNADFYAFCDQDDVWKDDKLITAVKQLEKYDNGKPNLYFSNLQMVDAQLNPIRMLFEEGEVKISKQMALTQVFTYGCTCVFNRSALVAYCKAEFTKELGHDNWIYIVPMFLGNVYYDNDSHILYRQHGKNVSGIKVKGVRQAFQRLKRGVFGYWGNDFELYSSMLLKCFSGQLLPDDEKYVKRIANYRKTWINKISLLFSPSYRTGRLSKDIAIKIRILTNHL